MSVIITLRSSAKGVRTFGALSLTSTGYPASERPAMNIFVLSEKLVSLGLFTLFAFKAVVSVMKFNEGKVGTIQYTVDEPNMLYPSIAACVLPRNWSVAATPAGKEAAGINFLRGVDYAFESLVFIEYSLTVGNG